MSRRTTDQSYMTYMLDSVPVVSVSWLRAVTRASVLGTASPTRRLEEKSSFPTSLHPVCVLLLFGRAKQAVAGTGFSPYFHGFIGPYVTSVGSTTRQAARVPWSQRSSLREASQTMFYGLSSVQNYVPIVALFVGGVGETGSASSVGKRSRYVGQR